MKLFIVAFVIIFLNYLGFIKILQGNFYYYFSPAILYLRESASGVKDLLILFSNIDEIRKENLKLKQLISKMETIDTQSLIESINLQEKESLRKFYDQSWLSKNNQVLLKKIIHYDPNSSKLVLENNDSDSIKDGSLVLVRDSLVGIVSLSQGKVIEVNLLSSDENSINTLIINKNKFKIKTILSSESGDSLVINNILTTEDVEVGDTVITSNTNQGLLPDLVIGKIQRIEGISSQTFRKAYIEKNYDLSIIDYVGVIVND